MEIDVQFHQADVCALPFEDNQFDLIMAESVTVFTNTSKSSPNITAFWIAEASCWTENYC